MKMNRKLSKAQHNALSTMMSLGSGRWATSHGLGVKFITMERLASMGLVWRMDRPHNPLKDNKHRVIYCIRICPSKDVVARTIAEREHIDQRDKDAVARGYDIPPPRLA